MRPKYNLASRVELEGFKMEVLVTGGSGLVGKNLVEVLEKNGMSVDYPR